MPLLKQTLQEVFGFEDFLPGQREIVEHCLAGGDALVIMPTGGGKSLLYQLPALLLPGLTVVVSPLVALMQDQVGILRERQIDAVFINSSLGREEREKRLFNLAAGHYRLLYVSPERFRQKSFLQALAGRKISLLAVDEAHCASQWGHDFRPDYSRLGEIRQWLGDPPVLALTATATRRVQKDIHDICRLKNPLQVHAGIERPNLALKSLELLDESEKMQKIAALLAQSRGVRLVYFTLIKNLEKFSQFLDLSNTRHLVYHGQLPSEKRKSLQKQFMQSDNVIMLATNAFGMGVDKGNIGRIVHADLPATVEAYYQEIGRAGRNGQPADCILLYQQEDLAVQLDFLAWRNPEPEFVRQTFRLLARLGENLYASSYEDLQEKLVYKNRHDHRLQSVLNQFDRYGVTEGSPETRNLRLLLNDLPDSLLNPGQREEKLKNDQKRLLAMWQFAQCPDQGKKQYLQDYFNQNEI